MNTMQAIRVHGINDYTIDEEPIPQPRADEVLVEVEVSGLCRTDLKLIEHGHRDGGFAEYVSVPAKSLIPVSSGLKAEEAVFAEPLSCCLNAVELGGVRKGMEVGIWGAGPAGTLIARSSHAKGARCFIADPDGARLERALPGDEAFPKPMGKERHFDTAFVAVGSAEAYEDALERLKPRGTLVVFSGLLPRQALRPVDFNKIHYLEQRIVGAYGCSFRHGEEALRLITEGKKEPGGVPVLDMISHRFPFSRLGEALSIVKHRRGMKVMLYPDRIFEKKEDLR